MTTPPGGVYCIAYHYDADAKEQFFDADADEQTYFVTLPLRCLLPSWGQAALRGSLRTRSGDTRFSEGPASVNKAARRAARDNLVTTNRRYTLKQGETTRTRCNQNKPVSIQ
jgi:hypothetical protein